MSRFAVKLAEDLKNSQSIVVNVVASITQLDSVDFKHGTIVEAVWTGKER